MKGVKKIKVFSWNINWHNSEAYETSEVKNKRLENNEKKSQIANKIAGDKESTHI